MQYLELHDLEVSGDWLEPSLTSHGARDKSNQATHAIGSRVEFPKFSRHTTHLLNGSLSSDIELRVYMAVTSITMSCQQQKCNRSTSQISQPSGFFWEGLGSLPLDVFSACHVAHNNKMDIAKEQSLFELLTVKNPSNWTRMVQIWDFPYFYVTFPVHCKFELTCTRLQTACFCTTDC